MVASAVMDKCSDYKDWFIERRQLFLWLIKKDPLPDKWHHQNVSVE